MVCLTHLQIAHRYVLILAFGILLVNAHLRLEDRLLYRMTHADVPTCRMNSLKMSVL